MHIFLGTTLLCAIVLSACDASDPDVPRGREPSKRDDLEVYSVVLSEDEIHIRTIDGRPAGEYLVVVADTDTPAGRQEFIDPETGEREAWLSEALPSLSDECLQSFVAVTRGSPRVLPQLEATVPVRMLHRARMQALAQGGTFWAAFWNEYPDAIALVALSGIGYSASGDQALVYVDSSRGGLASKRHLVHLVRDGGWRIEGLRLVSVS